MVRDFALVLSDKFQVLSQKYEDIKSFRKGVLPLLVVPCIFFALIILQPNMSTAGTIILVTFVMLFVAGMNMKFVMSMIGLGSKNDVTRFNL